VGLEIPIVMRILKERLGFKDLVAQVLTFDYLGRARRLDRIPAAARPAPGPHPHGVPLRPHERARGPVGGVALPRPHRPARHRRRALRLHHRAPRAGFLSADKLTHLSEEQIYSDKIIYAESTRAQRIVVTRWRDDLRLFLNGNLQFSALDEYRYHEALVHPALASIPHARRALVLGGGDGMALREILKYPNIEQVTLVDLDPGDDAGSSPSRRRCAR
jgi:spermidine synthase